MTWEIDPQHTFVEFSVKHFGVSSVKGSFPQVQGTLHLDPKRPETCWVKAQVKAESVYTGNPQRDAHLRSADFFDVVRYPTITFESTQVQPLPNSTFLLHGNLTLHGVTRPVTFRAGYSGIGQDHFTEAYRVGLMASTTIDRREFGMAYNQVKLGSMLAGYEISIVIHAEAILME